MSQHTKPRYRNREKDKEYYHKNKKRIIERIQKRKDERRKTDIHFAIKCRLRDRLGKAVSKNYKSGSAVSDLGCSVEEFKLYIQSKFSPGMTWENYGKTGWHLDHIQPLSKFNLQERNQLLEACHYTNLQPLWAVDNLKKSDKIS